MGLDQYLYADKYVSEYFDAELQSKVKPLIEELGMDYAPSNITINLMYWRKANAIHKWFVENVQNGVDDCGRYPVYDEHLTELKQAIETVLEDRDKAMTVLPPESGFFFGSSEITDYYWQYLQDTLDKVNTLLEQTAEDGPLRTWDIYYQSSW